MAFVKNVIKLSSVFIAVISFFFGCMSPKKVEKEPLPSSESKQSKENEKPKPSHLIKDTLNSSVGKTGIKKINSKGHKSLASKQIEANQSLTEKRDVPLDSVSKLLPSKLLETKAETKDFKKKKKKLEISQKPSSSQIPLKQPIPQNDLNIGKKTKEKISEIFDLKENAFTLDTLISQARDTSSYAPTLTSSKKIDSLATKVLKNDTLQSLSFDKKSLLKPKIIPEPPLPKNDLDEPVKIIAEKRIHYSAETEMMSIKEKVTITYKTFKLDADSVLFEPSENILTGFSIKDTVMDKLIVPVKMKDESDKDKKDYLAEKVVYNMKSKQGRVTEVKSKIKDPGIGLDIFEKIPKGVPTLSGSGKQNNVIGEVAKVYEDKVVNIQHGYYSSCDLPHPHFYFYGNQMRIEGGNEIVARPIILHIQDIPVLALPFLYFPFTKDKKSGLILPSYGINREQGLFFNGLGYYWAINDSMDFEIRVDFATRLDWKVAPKYRFVIKDLLDLKVFGEFTQLFTNDPTDHDFRREERWNANVDYFHTFDPSFKISASIKLGGGGSFTNNLNQVDVVNILRSQNQSILNLTKNFSEIQTFTLGFTRTQNLENFDGNNTINLSFRQVGQIFPFKTRDKTNGVLEKFSVSVNNSTLRVGLNHTDTTLLSNGSFSTGYNLSFFPIEDDQTTSFSQTLNVSGQLRQNYKNGIIETERYGAQFPMTLSFRTNLFDALNPTATINIQNHITEKTISKYYDEVSKTDVTTDVYQAEVSSWFSLSASLNTTLYGTLYTPFLEGIGLLGFRHKLIPTIGYSYTPDFRVEQYGYYDSYINQDGEKITYNRFENALYGSSIPSESQSLNFSLNNVFEMKYRPPQDTSSNAEKAEDKTMQLFTLNISSRYNFAAKEYNLSNISLSGNISSFTNLGPIQRLSMNFDATLDPYSYDNEGNQINKFLIDDRNMLFRLKRVGLTCNLDLIDLSTAKLKDNLDVDNGHLLVGDFQELNFNQKSTLSFKFSANLRLSLVEKTPLEPLDLNATLTGNLSINLTKGWRTTLRGGYDFKTEKITYPTISFGRNFHCWDMKFDWVPLGPNQTVNFSVGFTAPELKGIRYSRNGNSGNLASPLDSFP